MKAIVYVEGASDQKALPALLKPIIEDGRRNGIGISFVHKGSKDGILADVPRFAANSECTQRFKPFVQELREIVAGREPT